MITISTFQVYAMQADASGMFSLPICKADYLKKALSLRNVSAISKSTIHQTTK
jgi:hypothetical protein